MKMSPYNAAGSGMGMNSMGTMMSAQGFMQMLYARIAFTAPLDQAVGEVWVCACNRPYRKFLWMQRSTNIGVTLRLGLAGGDSLHSGLPVHADMSG